MSRRFRSRGERGPRFATEPSGTVIRSSSPAPRGVRGAGGPHRDPPARAPPARLAQALTGATLASLPGQVAVLDRDGKIVQVNQNWEAFTVAGDSSPAGGVAGRQELSRGLAEARTGRAASRHRHSVVEEVSAGRSPSAALLEYSLPKPAGIAGSRCTSRTLRPPGRGAVVVQVDVTQRHDAGHRSPHAGPRDRPPEPRRRRRGARLLSRSRAGPASRRDPRRMRRRPDAS